jgi:hypothetical protein
MANTRKPLTVGRKLLKMLLPPLNNLPLQLSHLHYRTNTYFNRKQSKKPSTRMTGFSSAGTCLDTRLTVENRLLTLTRKGVEYRRLFYKPDYSPDLLSLGGFL